MSVLFEERLREAMNKTNISQSELSRLAGISKASISQYLSNKNEPKHQVIVKLAEILGVDAVWLKGKTDAPLIVKPKVLRPEQAAKVLGSNADSVRIRMQKNSFSPPIGTACQLDKGSTKFTYEIFPEKLAAFLNIPVDAVFSRLNG